MVDTFWISRFSKSALHKLHCTAVIAILLYDFALPYMVYNLYIYIISVSISHHGCQSTNTGLSPLCWCGGSCQEGRTNEYIQT